MVNQYSVCTVVNESMSHRSSVYPLLVLNIPDMLLDKEPVEKICSRLGII